MPTSMSKFGSSRSTLTGRHASPLNVSNQRKTRTERVFGLLLVHKGHAVQQTRRLAQRRVEQRARDGPARGRDRDLLDSAPCQPRVGRAGAQRGQEPDVSGTLRKLTR
ncbi:hypothetical protein KL939_003940 [Ogataea angusta]|nr:hypothetical protein KL939_003940 [Ogataea angusta]